MRKGGYVYMLTNRDNSVIYTGVTARLTERIYQHRDSMIPGSFTSKYNCKKLVYFHHFPDITDAIAEEKRIKGGSRKKKIGMIESINPKWSDLWRVVTEG